nr:MAG TPA: hypothetical protein [Caudoviricetes sp.]
MDQYSNLIQKVLSYLLVANPATSLHICLT